jgi:plastocyanin
MSRISYIVAAAVATLVGSAGIATAQTSTHGVPHMIVVKLIERGGSTPYAFEPANIEAEHGDTVRFLQSADVPHNVRFTKEPSGAKLGGATTGPYLVSKGDKYDLIIDGRFSNGQYAFVCDPHESMGMHGSLNVVPPTASTGGK